MKTILLAVMTALLAALTYHVRDLDSQPHSRADRQAVYYRCMDEHRSALATANDVDAVEIGDRCRDRAAR